jgi:hypothetical protein
MQTIQSVKMQSQIHNTGSTSDHIQDMKIIAPLQTQRERQPLIQDKLQERNTRLNVGDNILSVLYQNSIEMMKIFYIYKKADNNTCVHNGYFKLPSSGKIIKTLSEPIWNKARFD